MAFFKFRKAAAEPVAAAPAVAPESVEALRRRARYRLAGAALLVLAGVIGFPLLFDNQPRPIAVDIPIDIPDKAKVKPLAMAPAPVQTAQGSEPAAAAAPEPKEEVIIPAKPAKAEAKAADKASDKVADKASDKLAEKPADKAADKAADRPADKVADKPADKAADKSGRFIVQFGAYADAAHAHEARMKVEKAGLKTYAQVIDGPDGKKFRVRVGPYPQRSEAEKVAEKIKKLDLPATVLGL